MYLSPWNADGRFAHHKFNATEQYADGDRLGHLRREIVYCNLGFLMSSAYECFVMRLWATGAIPMLADFWSTPAWSLVHLCMACADVEATGRSNSPLSVGHVMRIGPLRTISKGERQTRRNDAHHTLRMMDARFVAPCRSYTGATFTSSSRTG